MGIETYRQTGDIRAAQEILRQKTPEMAMRYTRAAVSDRVKQSRRALDKAWESAPHPVSTPRGKNVPKRPPKAQTAGCAGRVERGKDDGENAKSGR